MKANKETLDQLKQFGKRTFSFVFEDLTLEFKSLSMEEELDLLNQIGDYQRFPEVYLREYQLRAASKMIQTINGVFCGDIKEEDKESPEVVKEQYMYKEFLSWDLDIFSALWMSIQARLKLYLGKIVDKYGIENFLTPEELKYAELVEVLNDIKKESSE